MDCVTGVWLWVKGLAGLVDDTDQFSKLQYTENIDGRYFTFNDSYRGRGAVQKQPTEFSLQSVMGIPQEIISFCGTQRMGFCESKLRAVPGEIPTVTLTYEIIPVEDIQKTDKEVKEED